MDRDGSGGGYAVSRRRNPGSAQLVRGLILGDAQFIFGQKFTGETTSLRSLKRVGGCAAVAASATESASRIGHRHFSSPLYNGRSSRSEAAWFRVVGFSKLAEWRP